MRRIVLPRKVTDDGLAHLSGMTRLEGLSLAGTKIDGHGLVVLSGCEALEWVSFSRSSRVTDETLASLASLDSLEVVDLDGTGITDAGLVHLSGLARLRILDLEDTQVAGPGLEL